MAVTVASESVAAVIPTLPLPALCMSDARLRVTAPALDSAKLDVATNDKEITLPPPKPHQPSKHSSSIVHSSSQLLISRLRLNRNRWRHRALKQASSLSTLDQSLQTLATKHEALVSNLSDMARTLLQLKKSGRAKEKMQQRNLRLKALLNRFSENGVAARDKTDANTLAALKEALAVACERLDELEGRGEALLDALDRDDDDGDEGSEDGEEMGALEAEVAFRGVLEDDGFRGMREEWEGLLGE